MNDNYLITGDQGFIGRHVKELLPSAMGYDIAVGQDIRDKHMLLNAMKNIDVVIHLAAQTSVAHAWDDPAELYSHNIYGTQCVIDCAIEAGVKRIVFASSASVYDPYQNPYSFSKFTDEGLFKVMGDKIDYTAFRFMNVYGKGQNPAYGTVIPAFINGVKHKGEINIFGDGEQTRDYIHVKDIARGIVMGASVPKGKSLTMDLGTGVPTTVNEVATLVQEFLGKKAEINHLPPRRESREAVGDTGLARRLLGFEAQIPFEEGLKELCLEWE